MCVCVCVTVFCSCYIPKHATVKLHKKQQQRTKNIRIFRNILTHECRVKASFLTMNVYTEIDVISSAHIKFHLNICGPPLYGKL